MKLKINLTNDWQFNPKDAQLSDSDVQLWYYVNSKTPIEGDAVREVLAKYITEGVIECDFAHNLGVDPKAHIDAALGNNLNYLGAYPPQNRARLIGTQMSNGANASCVVILGRFIQSLSETLKNSAVVPTHFAVTVVHHVLSETYHKLRANGLLHTTFIPVNEMDLWLPEIEDDCTVRFKVPASTFGPTCGVDSIRFRLNQTTSKETLSVDMEPYQANVLNGLFDMSEVLYGGING